MLFRGSADAFSQGAVAQFLSASLTLDLDDFLPGNLEPAVLLIYTSFYFSKHHLGEFQQFIKNQLNHKGN